MKYLVLYILLPIICFSKTQILISESATHSLAPSKGLILQSHPETQKIIFQICLVQSQAEVVKDSMKISDCKLMGKKTGYSAEDIQNRIQQLENESSTHRIFKGSYIVLGTVMGALAGGVLAQQVAMYAHPSQMYTLISYFAGGIIVGGGTGLTLTVLTRQSVGDLLSQHLFSKEVEVLDQINSVSDHDVSLIVLKNSLQKTANDIHEVLIGIQQ